MAEMTPADKMARVKERITAVIADITAEATRFGWTLTDTSAYRNLTEALALLDSLEATEGHTLRGRGKPDILFLKLTNREEPEDG